eukprot:TRINITY_DN1848_c0_g1_i1.p1 TRINITY_DN1848_c0_g1~~TRINITY_DN1848_c0_g1_i1.p1  ORF type:complete len:475 (-),score=145.43 TRINITY_DN1848_c0_g1_i1:283-1707(-)
MVATNMPAVPRRRRRLSALACAAAAVAYVASDVSTAWLFPATSQSKQGGLTVGQRNIASRIQSRLSMASRGGEDADAVVAVGSKVKAMSSEDEQWYPGVVESIGADGSYVVKWDDPDGGPETEDVKLENIKPIVIYKDYKVGEEVHAVFPDDGNYYAATVNKINKDGTFGVKWEDPDGGPEESDVKPEEMKYPPIPVSKLETGQKFKGTVNSVRDFGAFVDFGAEVDGMVHISKIADERVDDIYQYVSEGQEIDVWVSEVRDDGRVALTMVESKIGRGGGGRGAPADLTPFTELSPDDWHTGVVQRLAPFGAFVKVTLPEGASADGLVHVSQIRDGFVESAEDELSEGQEVQVRVQSVDTGAGRMSLSMKEAGGFGGGGGGFRAPPDVSAFENVQPDVWLEGKVVKTANFGAFVEVTAPGTDSKAEGLVHITQIKEGFVETVEDELQEGQEVQVRVLNVDTSAGKMGLSMKPEF